MFRIHRFIVDSVVSLVESCTAKTFCVLIWQTKFKKSGHGVSFYALKWSASKLNLLNYSLNATLHIWKVFFPQGFLHIDFLPEVLRFLIQKKLKDFFPHYILKPNKIQNPSERISVTNLSSDLFKSVCHIRGKLWLISRWLFAVCIIIIIIHFDRCDSSINTVIEELSASALHICGL